MSQHFCRFVYMDVSDGKKSFHKMGYLLRFLMIVVETEILKSVASFSQVFHALWFLFVISLSRRLT